jgi:hypothetical protein
MARPIQLLFTAGLAAAVLFGLSRGRIAADTPPKPADSDTRLRWQRNLEAFHGLSPARQSRLRELDRELHEEDVQTRQRLIGVMQRYTAWLSRLPAEDRERIAAAKAGPDRLQVVRETMERHWFAALPQPLREEYASRPIERAALLEQWKAEERERRVGRAEVLRDLEFGATGLPLGDPAYRAELQK